MVNDGVMKSFFSLISSKSALLLFILALMAQTQIGNSQSACSTQLGGLGVCASFVLPGSTSPSPNSECCAALQNVDRDCLCNTLRIASNLPTQCHLSPLSCDLS